MIISTQFIDLDTMLLGMRKKIFMKNPLTLL